jgi:exopolysaccharide production protein ExoZ
LHQFEGVQVLRFVAAFLVVLTHVTFYAHERLDGDFPVWGYGTVGVDIFFCISGFVMILSADRLVNRKNGWKTFALRRLIRIVPMYWIATTIKLVTLLLASGLVLHAALDPGKTILSYLFLPSRNIDGGVEPLLGVGWTLIYEMFFYAIFAIGLWLRANLYIWCGTILTLCAVGNIFRGDGWPPALVYLDPIVLYFLVGMALGGWVQTKRTGLTIAALAYIAVVWAVIGFFNAADGSRFGTGQFAREIGVTLVVAAVVAIEPYVAGRAPRPLTYMGDASYTLYLFHPLMAPAVPTVLAKLGIISGWLSVGLSVIGVVVAAALIYWKVESPITEQLRRRLMPSRRSRAS